MSIRNMFRSLSLRSTSSSTASRSSASRASIASVFSSSSTSTSTSTTSTSTSATPRPRAAAGSTGSKITMTGVPEFEEVACDEKKEILIMASLKAPLFEVSPEEKRAPIDICCVIDESGSMEGEKLDLAKKAMEFVIDNLEDQDTLAIVCYDSNVHTVLTFTKMTGNGKSQAKATVAKMHTKDMTNLSGGLFEGLAQAHKRSSKNDVCSVLLFTDGQANVGLQDTASITAEMEKRLSQFSKKPSVFTFGFGSDHNQDMLRGIAECGGGMYYYLADADKIPLSFADCLGGLQSVVGQNLVLEVAGSTNVKILKSLNPKYKLLKGTLPCDKISLELGDIYSEEGRDIIFLVELPTSEESNAEVECVRLKLTYFNVLTTEDEVLEVAASVKRPKKVTNGQGNAQLDQQRNRLQAAEAMEKSRALADKGDLQGAKAILQKTKESIQNSSTGKETFSNNLMLELDQCTEDMRDTQHYASEGNKKVSRKAQAHYYQRSNKLEESEISFYETSAKVASKSKSKGIW